MTAILPKELLTATLGGLSLLVVSGGSDGDVLVQQSDGTYAPETLVTGDVFGPASSTDNAIARFDATTGKLLQNCVVTIGDTGNIAGLGTVSCGAITASGNLTLPSYSRITATSGMVINTDGNDRIGLNYAGKGIQVGSGLSIGFLPISTIDGSASDAYFVRNSASSIGVKGAAGIDGALTCGAITASGSITSSGTAALRAFFQRSTSTNASIAFGTTTTVAYLGVGTTNTVAMSANGDLTSSPPFTFNISNGNLTASGNVGIGGASLTAPLNIQAASSGALGIDIYGRVSNNASLINFYTNAGASQSYISSDSVNGLSFAQVSNLAMHFYTNNVERLTIAADGAITASGLVCMSIYTVATLPSASANAYKEANVSDALAPAMGVAVVGGGSVKTKVRSNGTDWTVCGI